MTLKREEVEREAERRFPLRTRKNTNDQQMMLALLRSERPNFRDDALALLNEGVEAKRINYVDRILEDERRRAESDKRIKDVGKSIVFKNIQMLSNNKRVNFSDKAPGECGDPTTFWELLKLRLGGDDFLKVGIDPATEPREYRLKLISKMTDWDFPPLKLLQNCKEMERRVEVGRKPRPVYETYKFRFEVR